MVILFVQNNIQKTQTQNTQWKQRYWWKRYPSMTRWNVRHFPPASGRMTPNNVCLWRQREHEDSNKRWRQRRFEPSQETGVKKMINGNVSSEFIPLWFASVHGAASFIQNCVSPLVLRLQKYKNGNSARRTASQRHIRSSICYGGSDDFGSGISGKLPIIATSNAIFSGTADRIAAKLCMTIKKITSNDIFQNHVHSCSTLITMLQTRRSHF